VCYTTAPASAAPETSDLFYVKNFTIALDLLIVFNTVKIVLLRQARHDQSAARVPGSK
jgi:lipopolysaccharide/colanic/teichoic acid biosynthesis glycosyltransferase